MRQVLLGRTKVKVSAISLGTWSYGGPNVSHGRSVGWAGQEDKDSQDALVKAWEVGINHWDTADVYGLGRNETLIGKALSDEQKEKVLIATKAGLKRPGGTGWHTHGNPEHIKEAIKGSLQRFDNSF